MFGPIEQVKTWAIIGLAVALLIAMGTAHYYRSEYKVAEAQYEGFVDKTDALGEAAKLAKKTKEDDDAKKIATAVGERDAALIKLRDAQRPRGGFVPGATGAAPDSRKICYDRAALDAALRTLDTGVSQLVGQGDLAVIDALTLLKAWPK